MWPVVLLLGSFRVTDLQTAESRTGCPLVLTSSLRQRLGVTLHGLQTHKKHIHAWVAAFVTAIPNLVRHPCTLTLALKWLCDAPDER